jgi:hypothetical protein
MQLLTKKLAHFLSYSSSPLHLSLTIFTSFSTTLISPEISKYWRAEGRRERRANAATWVGQLERDETHRRQGKRFWY